MSLAEQAVAKHTTVLESEKLGLERDRDRYRERYAELMLAGDDSPEAADELANVIFQLEDELTPDKVLADERAIQRARRLMGLHADLHEAIAERGREVHRFIGIEYVADMSKKYFRRQRDQTTDYQRDCQIAADELKTLAVRHPHLFDEGPTPFLLDADQERIAADARRSRRIELAKRRLGFCDREISDMESAVSRCKAGDGNAKIYQVAYEMWRDERKTERTELRKQLAALESDAAGE